MGLFQMAYVLYGTAITFAVSGLSVATSRLVAERIARDDLPAAGRALRAAVVIGLVTGCGFWLLLDRGAPYLAARVLGDVRVTAALRAIAPAILPVSLMSAFKGYFQGHQDMGPSSLSQILEQVVRVGTMIWLVFALRSAGLERAVGGAAQGTTIGALVALLMLVAIFARHPQPGPAGRTAPGRRAGLASGRIPRGGGRGAGGSCGAYAGLLRVAVPVTVGAVLFPLMDVMQTFLVPGRLQAAGLDPGEATYLYGLLHGMAYPLAGLPAIVASALAAALIPAISEAQERGLSGQVRSRTMTAIRLTVLFSLPATTGLLVLAKPINEMLFDIPEAGVPLAFVSASCLLIALQQTSSGVLQGLGRVTVPVYGLVAGLLANTAVTYVLTALPALGINGAALGIVAGFLVAAVANLIAVGKETRGGARKRGRGGRPARTAPGFSLADVVLRPLAATAVMAAATRTACGWVAALGGGVAAATVVAVVTGVLVYGMALLAVGGLTSQELELIPVLGPRLAALLPRGRR